MVVSVAPHLSVEWAPLVVGMLGGVVVTGGLSFVDVEGGETFGWSTLVL